MTRNASTIVQMRQVPGCDVEVRQCPNGCSFDELEVGRAQTTFMAVVGSPEIYICCGECDFNREEGVKRTAYTLEEAVANWNTLSPSLRGDA